MKTFMVLDCNDSWDVLRQSISHPKWWRVVITQRKIGGNSAALLSGALTQRSFRCVILAQEFALRKSRRRIFEKFVAKLSGSYTKMEKHSVEFEKYDFCVTFFALTSNGLNNLYANPLRKAK